MRRPNSALFAFPSAIALLFLVDAVSHAREVAVRRCLDHAEVVADEAVGPAPPPADGPDHPQLVGATLDRLLQVGVGDEHGVDVGPAVDRHRREPSRQRHTRDQEALLHLPRLAHDQPLPREVKRVERRFLPDAAVHALDPFPLQAPVLPEDVPAKTVHREDRVCTRELPVLPPVQLEAFLHGKAAPLVGDLLSAVALAPHRQVEDAAAAAVDMVEAVERKLRLVEQHL